MLHIFQVILTHAYIHLSLNYSKSKCYKAGESLQQGLDYFSYAISSLGYCSSHFLMLSQVKKGRQSTVHLQPHLRPRHSCRRPSTTCSGGSTYTTTSHRINPSFRGLERSPIPHTTPRSRQVQPSNKAQVILKWWNIWLPKPPSSPPPASPTTETAVPQLIPITSAKRLPVLLGKRLCAEIINTALKSANGQGGQCSSPSCLSLLLSKDVKSSQTFPHSCSVFWPVSYRIWIFLLHESSVLQNKAALDHLRRPRLLKASNLW